MHKSEVPILRPFITNNIVLRLARSRRYKKVRQRSLKTKVVSAAITKLQLRGVASVAHCAARTPSSTIEREIANVHC